VFDLLPERKVESAVTWMRSHPEIQAQGFPGKIRTVYRFIRTLRQEPAELPAPFVLDRVSVQEAIWLIARPESNLEADERTDLQELCQASSNQSGYIPSFDRKLKRLPL
jgi:hypothetical protein